MPNTYYPECWRIIRIKGPKETFYKVFGGWFGGFAEGDSWKLSSGFEQSHILLTRDGASIEQYSGSIYDIKKGDDSKLSSYLFNLFVNFLNNKTEGYEITEVTIDFDLGVIKEIDNAI